MKPAPPVGVDWHPAAARIATIGALGASLRLLDWQVASQPSPTTVLPSSQVSSHVAVATDWEVVANHAALVDVPATELGSLIQKRA